MSEVKDYREPWRVNEDDAILKSDNSFAYSDDDRARIVATVNACAGLTAAQLANVRKAVKFCEFARLSNETYVSSALEAIDTGFYAAVEDRKNGKDLGPELNALIDAEEA